MKRSVIGEIAEYIAEELKQVEIILNENLHSAIKVIPELSRYILESGGKRFRPMLTLLSARLCGYNGYAACVAGAVVEYIHTATLLHDDVVDESDRRRGRLAARKIWGNQASILVGDFLFARSFWLMTEYLPEEALAIISKACVSLAEGEIHQLVKSFDINTSEEDYYAIIYGKTAALIAASCEVGAVLASNGNREALRRYGREIGYAFQISDDILDIVGDPGKTGKPVGNDFREGKVTLPLIYALRDATSEEKRHIRDLLLAESISYDDFGYVREVILKYNGVEKARERVKEHGMRAVEAIKGFDNSKEKEYLIGIAEFLVEREY